MDAALLGRYYERFGDHAFAIAQQTCYLTTGQLPQPTAAQPATAFAAGWASPPNVETSP